MAQFGLSDLKIRFMNSIDCSIIVLNYFGEKTLKVVLDKLLDLDYPSNKYEIIVVDNDSKDSSKKIINKYSSKYKNIQSIFLNKNLGFSKGNNVGIQAAKGKYIALLNNDCFVDKRWLKELILTCEKDDRIFAVNPKVFLYPSFIYPKIRVSQDFVIKDIFLVGSNLLRYANKQIPIDVIWPEDPNNRIATLEIPFDKIFDDFVICQINLLRGDFSQKKSPPLKLIGRNRDKIEVSYEIIENTIFKAILKINIGNISEENKFDKVQNAGIMVFQEGSGRDIGAVVRYHKQYYEFDRGQFDMKREIYAACAVATLYRKDALDKIGYLDENFFMYYEDVEISERARMYGYKCFYNPKAYVRHLHALSSKEWSPFFIFNAEKGRYLHLLFYFPYPTYLFVIGFFRLLFNGIARLVLNSNKKNQVYNLQYLRLVWYFICSFPKLISSAMRRRSNIPSEKLTENLNNILCGRWYFEKN